MESCTERTERFSLGGAKVLMGVTQIFWMGGTNPQWEGVPPPPSYWPDLAYMWLECELSVHHWSEASA